MEELASSGAIPGYWLYGDSPAPPVPRFLHAERIVARAPRHDWQIRPHRHADLFQAFLITQGGAELELEGGHQAIAAPWLLWLPAGTVHGFHFSPDTDGQIITVSTDFMSAVLSEQNLAEIGATLSAPLSCPAEREDLAPSFAAIARALTQDEGALHTTIEAHLKLLLVAFSALLAPDTPAGGREEPGALLFRRFRQLVEQQYRRQWPVSRYVREQACQLPPPCRQAAAPGAARPLAGGSPARPHLYHARRRPDRLRARLPGCGLFFPLLQQAHRPAACRFPAHTGQDRGLILRSDVFLGAKSPGGVFFRLPS
jgi:AraC family transcriptional activator of pobA